MPLATSPSNSSLNSSELIILQNKLIDLKKKLVLEKQMYAAAKLIKVRMNKESNAQQVENSLKEYEERIGFIEAQIKESEDEIVEFKKFKCLEEAALNDNESEYVDAMDSLTISTSSSSVSKQSNRHIDTLKCLLANQKLSWPKIDYKINDLGCRLKVEENILEAKEKIIDAYNVMKTAGRNEEEINKLIEEKETSKQRVQLLQQSLKKYTSLISTINDETKVAKDTNSILSPSSMPQYTGKLLIKVTKIGGFSVGTSSNSPLTLSFNFNQQSSSLDTPKSSVFAACPINSTLKDPNNSTIFTCYQEIVINLVKSSELELMVNSSGGIKGMFFASLAAIFTEGPDKEASLSNSFEIEPAGVIDLQFHYSKPEIILTYIY